MIPARSIVLGFHASPTWTQDRGIARYMTEHVRALVGLSPEAIAQIDVEPGHTLPSSLAAMTSRVTMVASGTPPVAGQSPHVYSVMSPFDPVSLERIWPDWAREPEVALAVTLYDLIPLLLADTYLPDTRHRIGYMVRLGMVRTADVVMTDSQATADDAIRHLNLDAERMVVIGGGCSESFKPADRPVSVILDAIRRHLPGVRSGYLLYAGAADHRKNIVRLVEAYGELPFEVRRRHQLIIAGHHEATDRRDLERAALRSEVQGQIVFTGRVSDELLVRLYQGCLGFVFPSLYEGFGLPVLEAMSSGAPVIASDIPVLAELVPERDARFDPLSRPSIAASMLRLINEPSFRVRLQRRGATQARRHTWSRVAMRSLQAYESALNRRRKLSGLRRTPGDC